MCARLRERLWRYSPPPTSKICRPRRIAVLFIALAHSPSPPPVPKSAAPLSPIGGDLPRALPCEGRSSPPHPVAAPLPSHSSRNGFSNLRRRQSLISLPPLWSRRCLERIKNVHAWEEEQAQVRRERLLYSPTPTEKILRLRGMTFHAYYARAYFPVVILCHLRLLGACAW